VGRKKAVTNDLGRRLRDADPLRAEPPLSAADVESMRRRVLSAPQTSPDSGSRKWRGAVGAVVFACLLAVVVFVANRFTAQPVPSGAPAVGQTRQLQFETPGGTRVIWVLNPQLEL
jgi:hypothetical protein